MATIDHVLDLPEQICYVQCGFCTTLLLVSVPCSSLSMVVTVRCGHCTSLLSVNMRKASFIPLHLLAPFNHDEPKEEYQEVELQKHLGRSSPSFMTSSDIEDEDTIPANHIVNKPPEKRQRAPSAYNQFIKEEIRRLKAQNPNIAHKEAFSQAAKNWAQFPQNQLKADEERLVEEDGEKWNSDVPTEVNAEGKGFRERKVARHSMWEKTPVDY